MLAESGIGLPSLRRDGGLIVIEEKRRAADQKSLGSARVRVGFHAIAEGERGLTSSA